MCEQTVKVRFHMGGASSSEVVAMPGSGKNWVQRTCECVVWLQHEPHCCHTAQEESDTAFLFLVFAVSSGVSILLPHC